MKKRKKGKKEIEEKVKGAGEGESLCVILS
jgi:hypothetical protein